MLQKFEITLMLIFLWLLRDISTMQITTFFSFYNKKIKKKSNKGRKNQRKGLKCQSNNFTAGVPKSMSI